MTDLTIPNTFIPGTKAKAQEVNENFTAVKNAVNQRAEINGNEYQTFKVAPATQDNHAVNKAQFNQLAETLQETCNLSLTNFCAHSGNINSQGMADLMTYSSGIISFKVGDIYPDLVVSNAKGILSTITNIPNLNVSATTYSAFTPSNMTSNTLPSGYSASSTIDVTNAYKIFDGDVNTYLQTNDNAVEVIYEIPEKIIPKQIYILSSHYPDIAYAILGFELYGFSEYSNSYEHIITDLSNTIQTLDYQKTFYLTTNQTSHSYKKFKIIFKTSHGNSYPPRIQTFQINGLKESDTGLSTLDNETKNIFITPTGQAYTLSNSIFLQNTRPNMKKDDIWVNTQGYPLKVTKFDGENDTEFSDVLIGSIDFASGAYISHTTNPYNQNGYNINSSTTSFINNWQKFLPDYSKTIQWAWATSYYAPSNGWVYALGQAKDGYYAPYISVNGVEFCISQSGIITGGSSSGAMLPVKKGDYITTGNGTGGFTQVYFIPCKGD